MRRIAENVFNPKRYHLSSLARKRLLWMHILFDEEDGNVARSAKKIGVSRQWLSHLAGVFECHKRDPRSLEPESRAPLQSEKRKWISEETECAIVEVRKRFPWEKN